MHSTDVPDRPSGKTLTSKMPEQAQRRAPQGQPEENPPDNNHAYEELRHLIIAPEQEEIADIQERLEDRARRAEDVSSVVAEAISMRRDKKDGERALAKALAPTIQETLRESVRRDPHVLADALFPVMGPAIRKSITETLRAMLESFNAALEHSLSAQGIKWRIEAFRTGKSFGEIVLMHSLLYRVEQVFLIHRQTGLVLSHVVATSVSTQDPSMVAGMLSAIQQFVRDSFDSKNEETLGSLNVGELEVWIEDGPDAVIAAVIRGHAPPDYRLAMEEALEEIQQRYSSALENFKGDAAPFQSADELLSRLLATQHREPVGEKKPRAALATIAIVVILVLGWIGYSSYLLWEWSRFLNAVRGQPGIVVISYDKQGGRYHIRGFKDPLAPDPNALLSHAGLDPNNAEFDLAPYYSLDDAIVVQRARQLLHPPEGVTLSDNQGELDVKGIASPQWIAGMVNRAPLIPGINTVDVSHLQNSHLLQLKAPQSAIESVFLLFPVGRAELEPGQENTFDQAQKQIRDIVAQAERLGEQTSIELIGHTDSTGIEGTNQLLSKQRAEQVRARLLRGGVPPANLRPRGVGTTQPLRTEDTEEGRRLNRSVTFKVTFTPTSPVN
jgi:outer membrane protein OmpA-like peptidoglycan-associated protein